MMVGAVALCFRETQVMAAWGLIVTLVLVYPANVWCVYSKDARDALGASLMAAWIRLPIQGTLAVWCLWFTELQ